MTKEEYLNYEQVKDSADWDDEELMSQCSDDRFDENSESGDRATYGLSPMSEDTLSSGFHEFGESWIED